MGCGGIQPQETDFVGRAWCGRGLRDRHPSTTRPTARSLPLGARATGRQGGASTPSRSHSPRTSSARLVDRTAPGATRPWRRQRATASRPLAGPRPARTLTNSPRDTSSCTSDGPLISCRDRAPAAVTVAREPTAASSQPKGCAPTPVFDGAIDGESFRAYIDQILVPTLQPGDIVIADKPRGPQGRRHPAGPPSRRGHPLVLATLQPGPQSHRALLREAQGPRSHRTLSPHRDALAVPRRVLGALQP